MKVYGFEVTPEIEQACLERMVGNFQCWHITNAALNAGAPNNGVPDRIADRLIQRERKAGRIRRVGDKWERME